MPQSVINLLALFSHWSFGYHGGLLAVVTYIVLIKHLYPKLFILKTLNVHKTYFNVFVGIKIVRSLMKIFGHRENWSLLPREGQPGF